MSFRPFTQSVLLSATLLLITPAIRADLVVLQYHHVSDSTPSSTSTSVSLFEAQMDMVSRLGLKVVGLEQGTRNALNEVAPEQNQIALTFDDAYESVINHALPLLEQHNYPFTVFINTQAVGTPGYLTWEQLEELAANDLATLANHSANHDHLPRKPNEPLETWKQRIQKSLDEGQRTLKSRLNTEAPLFAYPFGEFDKALEDEIVDRGWYGYGQQSGAIGNLSSPTRLPRFPMANAYGQLNSLKDKLMSRAFPVAAAQLPDGVIKENPPTLSFTLPPSISSTRLTCFASGMGRIDTEMKGDVVEVRAPEKFSSRRFRYNCTHPAGSGRFFWLSQQWLDLSKPED